MQTRFAPSSQSYYRLRDAFLRNGDETRYDRNVRKNIVKRFERIDLLMDIVTTPTDGLFLAEAALCLDCEGVVVECGCFAGGSSAKLSILASILGRRLIAFDSFEGLPEIGNKEYRDYHASRTLKPDSHWEKGMYAARLEYVKSNVGKWGDLSVCSFVKGWFSDTLKDEHLPEQIAFAFTDVDLPSSATECIVSLWPRLSEKGVYFSHDVAFIKALQALADEHIWGDVLSEPRPILFGAGHGLCDASPHLGYFVKGRHLTPEYLKGLTIRK